MEITTIDNRDAYRARERKLRHGMTLVEHIDHANNLYHREYEGLKFQHTLRVEREVKRRMSLEVRDV